MKKELILATRGSALALAQAEEAVKALKALYPLLTVNIKTVSTKGDKDRTSALRTIGGDGLFVRGIEEELLNGTADIAVHCGKDLPYKLAEGLEIAAVLPAASSRDVLISRFPITELMEMDGPVIGTGSPRRQMEMEKILPKASFADCRGNVTTRIETLRAGKFDAIILAEAGLDRLGISLDGLYIRDFSSEEFIPAACQGILVIECRADDAELTKLLKSVEDKNARIRFDIERAVFAGMQADCIIPAGVHAKITGDMVAIQAMLNGRKTVKEGKLADADHLIREVTEELCRDS